MARQAKPKQLIEGDRRRIKITEAEIQKAKPQQSGRCLVARAIAAKFTDATRIDVDQQTIRFTRDGERWVYLTPWAVQRYIVQFDAGDPIDPFEFSLTQSVQIQKKNRTEAGLAVDRTGQNVRNRRKQLEHAQATLLPPSPSEPGAPRPRPGAAARAELAERQEALKAAEAERAAVRAEVGDAKQTEVNRPDVPARGAMTQKGITRSRTSKRTYGHREMRINQDRATRSPQAIEAEAGLDLPPMPKGGYATA